MKGRHMAAQLTAAVLMLILTWFSIHQLIGIKKTNLKAFWVIVGFIAFVSWSGNILTTMDALSWLCGSILIVVALVMEKRYAVKK
jgi:hypothetical protein